MVTRFSGIVHSRYCPKVHCTKEQQCPNLDLFGCGAAAQKSAIGLQLKTGATVIVGGRVQFAPRRFPNPRA
jgi:hypothetical protein